MGRKLNRSDDKDISQEDSFISDFSLVENFEEKSLSLPSLQQEPETTQTMATTSNRIESEKTPSSRITEQTETDTQESFESKKLEPIPVNGLEETAAKLGVEPEFLVEKGTKALLRMIARNGGQLRFPLEIDQID